MRNRCDSVYSNTIKANPVSTVQLIWGLTVNWLTDLYSRSKQPDKSALLFLKVIEGRRGFLWRNFPAWRLVSTY